MKNIDIKNGFTIIALVIGGLLLSGIALAGNETDTIGVKLSLTGVTQRNANGYAQVCINSSNFFHPHNQCTQKVDLATGKGVSDTFTYTDGPHKYYNVTLMSNVLLPDIDTSCLQMGFHINDPYRTTLENDFDHVQNLSVRFVYDFITPTYAKIFCYKD